MRGSSAATKRIARGTSRRTVAAVTALTLMATVWILAPDAAIAGSAPVIAAAGDIACDPANPAFNNGKGTRSECRQRYTGNMLERGGFRAVLPLGDIQYECGGAAAFNQSYDPAWGAPAVKNVTRPVPGNHEYQSSGGTDCGKNASAYFSYFGSAAAEPGKGWYSYNIGSWHLIALNSNCARISCVEGGPQEQWLANDLERNSRRCTLAYFHHPAFSAGATSPSMNPLVLPFWRDLYQARAELVLNGHKHNYQRMKKLDATGSPDKVRGIRQFIVGTGGSDLSLGNTPYPGTQVSDDDHFGILKLTLRQASYKWRFVALSGQIVDQGSEDCLAGRS